MILIQRDLAYIYPQVNGTDADGNPRQIAGVDPLPIRGHFGPVSSEEAEALGQVTDTLAKFVTRQFPAGAFSRFEFAGREYDIVGEPLRYRGASYATRSVTVLLRARDQEKIREY